MSGETRKPKIFYVYPFDDAEIASIVNSVSQESGVQALTLADKIDEKESTIEWTRRTIASCDFLAVIITKEVAFSPDFGYIMRSAASMGRMILYFLQGPRPPQAFFKIVVPETVAIRFDTRSELPQRLRHVLVDVVRNIPSDYVRSRNREDSVLEKLNDSMNKNFLIIGKDSDDEGLLKIDRIKTVVRENGFNPVVLRELPDIDYISLESKMIRVASLCRFIIAEDSRASGHIDEVRICVGNEFITAILREAGCGSTWMQAHYIQLYDFIKRFCYANDAGLDASDILCNHVYDTMEDAADQAIEWASWQIRKQREMFRPIYGGLQSNHKSAHLDI